MSVRPRRRDFLRTLGATGLCCVGDGIMIDGQSATPAAQAMDHLIVGAADLDAGIAHVERLTGVRAAIGGSHPGRGTRNALLSLGRRQYLEVLAPDPAQRTQSYGWPFDVRQLATPRLIGWAAATSDASALALRASAAGLSVSGPRDGMRARPDGRTLRWTTVDIAVPLARDGVDPVPFFIQWAADSRHPSEDSPGGCNLQAFTVLHPEPGAVAGLLQQLGIDLPVTSGAASLRITLQTPRGRVELA